MRLGYILFGSFNLVSKEPKLFVPRLFMTTLYTIMTLYTAVISAAALTHTAPVKTIMIQSIILLCILPLLYLVDVLVYAMYPCMIVQRQKSNKINLGKALSEALKSYKTLTVFAAVVFAYSLVVSLIAAPLLVYSMYSGNLFLGAIVLAFVFVALIGFSIIVFFVVPSATISGKGILESFKESFSLGISHRKDLLKLNIFFAALAVATLYVVFKSELSGNTDIVAISAFVFFRLMQAIIYTYLSVVNPTAYLDVRN